MSNQPLPAASGDPAVLAVDEFPSLQPDGLYSGKTLTRRIESAIAKERERCAKIADTWEKWCGRKGYDAEGYAPEDIAAKIRSGENA